MELRCYQPSDLSQLGQLFYDTVHTICARDYSREQLDAWATGTLPWQQWNDSLLAHYSLVAQKDGILVGFGDLAPDGYLDRLYVHRDYQHQHIGTALCEALESKARQLGLAAVTTHASRTARPFFARRGYALLCVQTVERHGVLLENFPMRLSLEKL